MSKFINPEANAFPMVVAESTSEAHPELTRRELFAVWLLAGYISADSWEQPIDADDVKIAIEGADLLIKELIK